MIRSILAVVAGVVTWIVAATVLNVGLRLGLPGYVDAEPTMAFTLPMLVGRLAIALATSVLAGAACGWVGRGSGKAGWAFAVLMLLLFVPLHLKLWHAFPVWYHLFFLLTLAPTLLMGVALGRRRARQG
ncbi:MAG: hypothetical protein U1F08_07770 [Steroidobacteraceae bacterium]